MGLHHQSNHGRVFHALEAREHLEAKKRDSHGNFVKLHVPGYMKAAARPADPAQTNYVVSVADKVADVQTVQSVVYVTMPQTFSGPAAGYVTMTAAETSTDATSAASSTATSASVDDAEASYLSAKSAASGRGGSATAPSTSTVVQTVMVTPTSVLPEGHDNKSVFLNPAPAATSTDSAVVGGVQAGSPISATRVPQPSSGMSGGATAGLAIGLLLALGAAAGLLFFCMRRRKNAKAHQEIVDEKHSSTSPFGAQAMSEKHASVDSDSGSSRTASTAPRLSLRPVTQFLPSVSETRKSSSNMLAAAAAAMSEKPKSMWERRSNVTENPFADSTASSAQPAVAAINPFEEQEAKAGNSDSTDSAAAAPGTNNVHRVQLDFKPSMDDELELKSGQLVRMLHEYDDGWALCVSMDRSKQGVTPRTCLSKLPVKPRPQSPASDISNGPAVMAPMTRDRSESVDVPARKPVPGQAI